MDRLRVVPLAIGLAALSIACAGPSQGAAPSSTAAAMEDLHLHVAAQQTAGVTFTPQQTGTFAFYCTIPGHRESGMTGKLTVQ